MKVQESPPTYLHEKKIETKNKYINNISVGKIFAKIDKLK